MGQIDAETEARYLNNCRWILPAIVPTNPHYQRSVRSQMTEFVQLICLKNGHYHKVEQAMDAIVSLPHESIREFMQDFKMLTDFCLAACYM